MGRYIGAIYHPIACKCAACEKYYAELEQLDQDEKDEYAAQVNNAKVNRGTV